MYSVLLQEEPVQEVPDATLSIPVAVTVLIPSKEKVSFEPATANDYKIEPQSILLVGSGGAPREFLVTYTLSAESIEEGYTFANPALKFFQGSTKNAGFRVNRNPDQVSAVVSLFNTKTIGEAVTMDEFSLLFFDPEGVMFAHDPSIVWDPPNG